MPRYEVMITAMIDAPDQATANKVRTDVETMLKNPLVTMQLSAKRVTLSRLGEPKLAGAKK